MYNISKTFFGHDPLTDILKLLMGKIYIFTQNKYYKITTIAYI